MFFVVGFFWRAFSEAAGGKSLFQGGKGAFLAVGDTIWSLLTPVIHTDCVPMQSIHARKYEFEVADVIALREVCPNSPEVEAYSKCKC